MIQTLSFIMLHSTVLKMLKSKLPFIKKWLKQKRCALIHLHDPKISDISDPKKCNNIANLDINCIITNFLQLFTFLGSKLIFFVK